MVGLEIKLAKHNLEILEQKEELEDQIALKLACV